ncbi:MAG: hypothetical protein JEZ11_11250 [Desulfobacterales bacterium]|nr:hypothetical protein [Desulfobacterales bacterium]
MILHPLLFGALVMDALGLLLVLGAARTAVAVALRWSPETGTAAQLTLEGQTESAGVCCRMALAIWMLATIVLVAATAEVMPSLVPGAMCGTGVLQAMGRSGTQTLILRLLLLLGMGGWLVLDRINSRHPLGPMTDLLFRWWLVLTPLAAVAFWVTASAIWHLDPHTPVSCCTAVYDAALAAPGAHEPLIPDTVLIGAWAAASLVLVAIGLHAGVRPDGIRPWRNMALVVMVPIWSVAALTVTSRILAAYYYEVLYHHCLWCLFLPEHQRVGWLVFGAWGVVLMEGTAAWVAASAGQKFPEVAPWAAKRQRRAMIGIAAAVIVFSATTGLPALVWRFRFGMWMSG